MSRHFMSIVSASSSASVVTVSDSSARPTSRPTIDDGVGGAVLEEELLEVGDLRGAVARRGVVDREHQVGLGDRSQPLLDDRTTA